MNKKVFLPVALLAISFLSGCSGAGNGSGGNGGGINFKEVFQQAFLAACGLVKDGDFTSIDSSSSFTLRISNEIDSNEVSQATIKKDQNIISYTGSHLEGGTMVQDFDDGSYYKYDTSSKANSGSVGQYTCDQYYLYPNNESTKYKIEKNKKCSSILETSFDTTKINQLIDEGNYTVAQVGDKVYNYVMKDESTITISCNIEKKILLSYIDERDIPGVGHYKIIDYFEDYDNTHLTLPTNLYTVSLADAYRDTRSLILNDDSSNYTFNYSSDFEWSDGVYYHPHANYLVDHDVFDYTLSALDNNNNVVYEEEEAFLTPYYENHKHYADAIIQTAGKFVNFKKLEVAIDNMPLPITYFDFAIPSTLSFDSFTEERSCVFSATFNDVKYTFETDGEQYITSIAVQNSNGDNKNIHIQISNIGTTATHAVPKENVLEPKDIVNDACDSLKKPFEYVVTADSYTSSDELAYDGYKVQYDNSNANKEVINIVQPDGINNTYLVFDKVNNKRYSYTLLSQGGYEKKEITEEKYLEEGKLYFELAKNEVDAIINSRFEESVEYAFYFTGLLPNNFTNAINYKVNNNDMYKLVKSGSDVTFESILTSHTFGKVGYVPKSFKLIDSIAIPE